MFALSQLHHRAAPSRRRDEHGDSSISEGIAIDHDLAETALIGLIGTSLDGVAMAANEMAMTNVSPSISVLVCDHGSAPPLGSTPPNDAAVLQAIARVDK